MYRIVNYMFNRDVFFAVIVNKKVIRRIKRYIRRYPDQIYILFENRNILMAYLPVRFLHCMPSLPKTLED